MALQLFNQTNIQDLPSEVREFISNLDIYYQPEFLRCDAHMQNGSYEIAVYSENNEHWVYPYIILPIPGFDHFDLSSPYGYAGPVATSETICKKAEELFVAGIQKRGNIVTEFIRYHYLYNRDSSFETNIQNLLNRRVVLLPTEADQNEIWTKQFSGTNRNLVRKLEKEEYKWSVNTFTENDIVAFDDAYRANMKHTQADDFYFFSIDFYREMITLLGSKLQLAKVEKDGVIYASALFFVSGGLVTYYLSARNLDFPKVPASNLLLSKMGFWSHENGFKFLNFGGGLSLAEEDHLFKFKRNFGQQIEEFRIGKRIHQPELYEELKQRYISKSGQEAFDKVKQILQFYR